MEFTMSRDEKHPQRIIVTGEGIEMVYYEAKTTDGKLSGMIKRTRGEVEGTHFTYDDWNWYWKKSGRGGYKDKEKKLAMIKEADTFLYLKGFIYLKK